MMALMGVIVLIVSIIMVRPFPHLLDHTYPNFGRLVRLGSWEHVLTLLGKRSSRVISGRPRTSRITSCDCLFYLDGVMT